MNFPQHLMDAFSKALYSSKSKTICNNILLSVSTYSCALLPIGLWKGLTFHAKLSSTVNVHVLIMQAKTNSIEYATFACFVIMNAVDLR